MTLEKYDVAIIGAGPAGLSAATLCANHGANVILFDEQNAVGGQIYRHIEHSSLTHQKLLGPDYQKGKKIAEAFKNCSATYVPKARVWHIDDNKEIAYSTVSKAQTVHAENVILATGAMERPVPFPGWTLPGVMNAGAGQVLFKAHELAPSEDVILAGSGPLLLLLAWQYLQAGIKVQAVLDLTPGENHFQAIKHLPKALLAFSYLRKGLVYEWQLKRAGIPFFRNVSNLQACGEQELSSVSFLVKGVRYALNTQHLLVHFGVIPSIQLSQSIGCEHLWDKGQQCWRPKLTESGETNLTGIYIAGDGAGINGAVSAQYSGEIAALDCLSKTGKISASEHRTLSEPLYRSKAKDQRIRPFLEAYFRVPTSLFRDLPDDTLVCRCEEVTALNIRDAVRAGHTDCNQVKFLTRCGMGPCQGRQCAQAVSHIVAAESGKKVEHVGTYRARSPSNRLSLGELASLYPEEQE
ncbi:MAG: FAD-dependent oxidoreductase [Aestuariibacter sp.]